MTPPPPPPPPADAAVAAGVAPPVVKAKDLVERVYVWDWVVRSTHWVIVFSVLILTVTGIYIGDPFIIVEGEARENFVMGTVKTIHFYTAIFFTLSVLSRILWMFIGPYYARWHQFIPTTKERIRGIFGILGFYLFLRKDPPMCVGHNPLAGVTYSIVFVFYMVMILTGLGMYSVYAGTSYMSSFGFLLPFFGGPQTARIIHHIGMWVLLGFFAHHVWSAFLVANIEENGTMGSIFSGYKFFPQKWRKKPNE